MFTSNFFVCGLNVPTSPGLCLFEGCWALSTRAECSWRKRKSSWFIKYSMIREKALSSSSSITITPKSERHLWALSRSASSSNLRDRLASSQSLYQNLAFWEVHLTFGTSGWDRISRTDLGRGWDRGGRWSHGKQCDTSRRIALFLNGRLFNNRSARKQKYISHRSTSYLFVCLKQGTAHGPEVWRTQLYPMISKSHMHKIFLNASGNVAAWSCLSLIW